MSSATLDRRAMRPFVWVAWLGVLTTATNTIVPALLESGVSDATAEFLRNARLPVLLAHSLASLLPMLGLAIVGFRLSPFAATVAVAYAVSQSPASSCCSTTGNNR